MLVFWKRSKLLLSMVPKNRNRRVEFSLRLNLWHKRDFEQLLHRVQDQARNQTRGTKKIPCVKKRGRKARYLVPEGVRARAVTTLTLDLVMLSREDELKYVGELLPCSTRPGVPDLPENHEVEYSLKGVRFKVLSAPGPSGARPEHLREMLSCPNKRTARRMVGSVSKFVDIAQRGRLPTQARFILDSRLIYLRKNKVQFQDQSG